MTTWGRVINGHVFQLSDVEPSTLFTAEECENWQILPEGVTIGSEYFEDRWWTGAEYLEEMLKRTPPSDPAPPMEHTDHPGAVLEIEIAEAGSNYVPEQDTKGQFDVEVEPGQDPKGRYLVLEVMTDENGSVDVVTIVHPGIDYKVGDEFLYKDNYHITWSKRNPTYAKFRVTKVQDK